ncbi:MAG TPA: MmcQ/YjbR family DNA-binding protein [Polyangia bacterium]|jgi:predicted DNA-binding protein (MmcQ/YjbR family)|nr:MmcQ/YjbR family DNA-binding protein [Polyangia bacterium]
MDLAKTAERLRQVALRYPETYEESPWGDRVVKVRGKIFLFCGVHEGALHVSVKLPQTGREVLQEPWAKPTPYGLGKSGWVSARFEDDVPEDRIAGWIDESYRALAPKKLVALLVAPEPAAVSKPAAKAKKPAAKAQKKVRARVSLLCLDRLRAQRAVKALAERGIAAAATDNADDVRAHMKTLDAVIIDIGRLQDDGIALAGEIDESDYEIHLFIVGVRDAKARKRAQAAATSAELFTEPPGDPAVADAVLKALAR